VPHKTQEEDKGCLAACTQMVLAHLGVKQSQRALNRLFSLTSIGVPFSNIRRIAKLGLTVALKTGNEDDLRRAIDQGLPPVVFVFTGALSYWAANTSHALVVVGYDEAGFFLNDPVFGNAPQYALLKEFMLAWSEHNYSFALISLG
jgi:ABC-type bacteriocin/lantibiotic exporter with double-glycine peptidase domain